MGYKRHIRFFFLSLARHVQACRLARAAETAAKAERGPGFCGDSSAPLRGAALARSRDCPVIARASEPARALPVQSPGIASDILEDALADGPLHACDGEAAGRRARSLLKRTEDGGFWREAAPGASPAACGKLPHVRASAVAAPQASRSRKTRRAGERISLGARSLTNERARGINPRRK